MKYYASLLLLVAVLFLAGNCKAQNTKHVITSAKVVYDVTLVSSENAAAESVGLEDPIEYTLYFKKAMSRVEMNSGENKISIISDNLSNKGTMLMDMNGMKMAMKMDSLSPVKKNGQTVKPAVVITRESKLIAGYLCYKANVTSVTKSGTKSYVVWFNSELKGNYSYDTKVEGINGLMMEFESKSEGKVYKMTAKSVDTNDILADDLFVIPSDYKIVDKSGFKSGMSK